LSGMLGFLGQPDDPAGEVMNGLVFEVHAHRRSTPSVAAHVLHLQRNWWSILAHADGQYPSEPHGFSSSHGFFSGRVPAAALRVPINHPARSSRMPILPQDAPKSITSMDVERRDPG
jgi:hypothetical protein